MPDSSTNGKQPLNDKMTVQSANTDSIPDAAEMISATESKAPEPCAAPDLALTTSSYTEDAPGQLTEPKQEETIETTTPPLQPAAPSDAPPAIVPVPSISPSKSTPASDSFVRKLPRHSRSCSNGSFPSTILETGESVVSSVDDKLSAPKVLENSPRTLVTRSAPVSANSSPLVPPMEVFPAESLPLEVPPLSSLAAQLLPVNTPTSQPMSSSDPSSPTNSPAAKKGASRFKILKQAQQAVGPSTTDAAQGSAAVLPPAPVVTTIETAPQAQGSASVSSAPAPAKQSRFKVVNQTSSQSITPTSATQAPPSNAPNNAQPETPAPSLPPRNISVLRRQSSTSSGQAPLHPIASSDSLSLGSAPCAPENFDLNHNSQFVPQENVAALQQQQQQQQFDDANQQQQMQEAIMVHHTTQLLVAVPLKQAPNEYEQQVQQQASGEDGNQHLPQQQQQQQQTMPVVKMGTKKKGRFKLLEENTGAAGGENALSSAAEPTPTPAPTPTPTPTTAETPAPTQTPAPSQEQAPTPATSQTPAQIQTPVPAPVPTQMLNATEQAPVPSKTGIIPRSIALPIHDGVSCSSAVSQLSTGVSGTAHTFDGTNVPTMKKKGRFVVTNVKVPGMLSAPAAAQKLKPQQQEQAPVANSESPTQQQSQRQIGQQQQSQHIQQNEQQQQQPQNQQSQQQQQFMSQSEQSISSLQSNYVDMHQFQPYMTQQTLSGPAVIAYSTQGLAPQQHAYQLQQYTIQGGQQYIAVEAIPQQAQLQQEIPQQIQVPLPTSNQTSTPSATPGSVATGSLNDSQWGAQAAAAIPNAPVPHTPHPQSGDKAKLTSGAVKWKPAQSKTPQSFDKRAGGLGKVFHYLEQMKMEVTDADRTIKTLQTDMKFLRQKNKEWEAKNREMEKKVQEERILREAAEAKLRDLRKRLREEKIDINTLKHIEVGAGENPGKSRANPLMDPPVATAKTSGDTAQQGQPSGTIDTATKAADGATRPKPPTQAGGADIPTAASKSKPPAHPVDPPAPRKSTVTRSPAPSPQNGAVAKGAKPKPKAVPIASNGMAKTNAATDSGVGKTLSPKPIRGKASSNVQAQTNNNPASNIAHGAPSLPRAGSETKLTQPGQPSLQSGGAKQAATAPSPAPNASHASDFDPLRPTASQSDIPSDVVISIPASVTLENRPIFSGPAVFQTTNDQGMVTGNAFQQVTPILSQNPFIVFTNNELQNQGLVQTSPDGLQIQSNGGNLQGFQQHAIMTGGFHDFQQQPVVVVQPPIMLQQVPNVYAGQWTQQTIHVQNPQAMSENQAQQQHQNQNQHHRQRKLSSASNPFGDPFDDPFDDLLVNQSNP